MPKVLCIGVLIIEALFMGVLHSVGLDETEDILASLMIMIFSLAYCAYVMTSTKKYKGVWMYLMLGYLFRVFLLYFNIYGEHIFRLPSTGDQGKYWRSTLAYAYDIESGISREFMFGEAMKLVGEQRLLIQFIMIFSYMITFIVVLKILHELEIPQKVIKISMFLLAFLPLYAIHSSAFMREAYPVMFGTISLLFFIKWYLGKGEMNFIYAMMGILVAGFFHSGAVIPAGGYVLVRLFYNKDRDRYMLSTKSIIAGFCIFAAVAFMFLFFGHLFFEKIRGIRSINQIDGGASNPFHARSSYVQYVGDSSSIGNIIKYTPLRMILFLFGPIPPFVTEMKDVIAMVFSSFFYMYTYYRAIIYIHHKGSKYRTLAVALLIIGLSAAFVFGWGRTDFGTNVRHRDKIVTFYIVLLAICLADKKPKKYRLKSRARTVPHSLPSYPE